MVSWLGQALVRVDGNDVDDVGAWTGSCERALTADTARSCPSWSTRRPVLNRQRCTRGRVQ